MGVKFPAILAPGPLMWRGDGHLHLHLHLCGLWSSRSWIHRADAGLIRGMMRGVREPRGRRNIADGAPTRILSNPLHSHCMTCTTGRRSMRTGTGRILRVLPHITSTTRYTKVRVHRTDLGARNLHLSPSHRQTVAMSQAVVQLDSVLNFRDVGRTINEFLGER